MAKCSVLIPCCLRRGNFIQAGGVDRWHSNQAAQNRQSFDWLGCAAAAISLSWAGQGGGLCCDPTTASLHPTWECDSRNW
jgi:hypothetical protein